MEVLKKEGSCVYGEADLFEHVYLSEESMKKTLLALGLFTLGSFNVFAAPCTNGTLASLNALNPAGCTITNGANTWTLTGFTQSAPASGNFAGITPNDLNISFSLWNWGFSVTTSVAGGFGVVTGESGFVETNFRIGGNVGTALLTSFGASVNPGSYAEGTPCPQCGAPPQVQLIKYVQSLDSLSQAQANWVQLELIANYVDLPNFSNNAFAPPLALNPALVSPSVGSLVVVDKLTLTGGARTGAAANAASFTNYFAPAAPTGDIPEPMTFALMGAGLIGLAVLRRRQK